MFRLNMRCSLWDLVDEGFDTVLDRLQGEAGVTGITVPVLTAAANEFRLHADVAPRMWRSPGGLQFQPDPTQYTATRIHLTSDTWLKKKKPLATLAEACGRKGLNLRAALSACDCAAIVHAYPAGATKNVFGDASIRRLCPVNPDVRAFLSAVVRDLSTNHPLESILIEEPAFADLPPCKHARTRGFRLGHVVARLRNLCFCESCRQSAAEHDVNADAAARSVTVTLEDAFQTGKQIDMPWQDFLDTDDVLNSYVQWQRRQVTLLISSISQACSCRLVLYPNRDADASGLDPRDLSGNIDGLAFVWNDPEKQSIEKWLPANSKIVGGPQEVEVNLVVGDSAFSDGEALTRAFRQAAEAGVRTLDIDHYSQLPLAALAWLPKASRHPKRIAVDA